MTHLLGESLFWGAQELLLVSTHLYLEFRVASSQGDTGNVALSPTEKASFSCLFASFHWVVMKSSPLSDMFVIQYFSVKLGKNELAIPW